MSKPAVHSIFTFKLSNMITADVVKYKGEMWYTNFIGQLMETKSPTRLLFTIQKSITHYKMGTVGILHPIHERPHTSGKEIGHVLISINFHNIDGLISFLLFFYLRFPHYLQRNGAWLQPEIQQQETAQALVEPAVAAAAEVGAA
ncbi:hypothetical protein ACJX0J_023418 [Zea mays]